MPRRNARTETSDPQTSAENRRPQILQAAIEEFGEKGLAGARVDEIARRSGSNKQLIYYYFQNKEGLYRAALGALIEHSHEMLAQWEQEEPEPWAEEELRLQQNVAESDPFLQLWRRFWMWEALEEPGSPIQHERSRRAVFKRVVARVEAAQSSGEIDPEFDPQMLFLALHAIRNFPYLFPQVTKLITGELPTSNSFKRRYQRQLELLLDRLAPAAQRQELTGAGRSSRPADTRKRARKTA